MGILDELIKPKFTIVNGSVDLSERFKERATRPIINSKTIATVDGALDCHSADALKANRESRRLAFQELRNR